MAQGPSPFGGVAGQSLRDALGRTSWFSGMALTSALFLTARGLGTLDQMALFPAAAVPLVCVGLAYHATAARGGANASRTLSVGLQAALASMLWVVPWMLWSTSRTPGASMLESMGAPTPIATAAYFFLFLMATPVLLIAATQSRRGSDVFSPPHWSRQLRGRGSDLMTVYTIQAGGIVLAAAFAVPLVELALRWSITAGLAAAAVALCFVLGYWIGLTGRLCGSLHAAPQTTDEVPAASRRFDAGLVFAGPAVDTGFNRDMPEMPHTEEIESPTHHDEPVAAPETSEPAEAATTDDECDPADEQAVEPEESAPTSEAVRPQRYATSSQPVAFEMPKPSKKDRRTPLLDAEARVEEALIRFRLDPSHTLSKLAELNQRFAANPQVLQALTICLHRTGHTDQAFKAARQAFPLCFEHGLVSLAAAMFYELRGQLHRLELKKHEVLAVAEVLHKADELAAAAKAYSLVVHADGADFAAIKGLLDVAERILEEKDKPEAALKVYMFLLEHSDDPGMTEIVRDAISRCRDAEEAAQPTV